MVLTIAGLAIWIAQDENNKVLKLVEFAWAGFGSAFGPVVLLSLFWKRMTSSGAMAGMLAGAVVVFGWKHWVPADSVWHNVYEMIPAFGCAALSIIIVSLLSPKPSRQIEDRFRQANQAYKDAQ